MRDEILVIAMANVEPWSSNSKMVAGRRKSAIKMTWKKEQLVRLKKSISFKAPGECRQTLEHERPKSASGPPWKKKRYERGYARADNIDQAYNGPKSRYHPRKLGRELSAKGGQYVRRNKHVKVLNMLQNGWKGATIVHLRVIKISAIKQLRRFQIL